MNFSRIKVFYISASLLFASSAAYGAYTIEKLTNLPKPQYPSEIYERESNIDEIIYETTEGSTNFEINMQGNTDINENIQVNIEIEAKLNEFRQENSTETLKDKFGSAETEDIDVKLVDSANATAEPIVIHTWQFIQAGRLAWKVIEDGGGCLDAVEQGCSKCEELQCGGTVGYGGSPDEVGETTLDAMIMDGQTYEMGAVGALRGVKNAISVARAVMERTHHTFLVGSQATDFALMMGFKGLNLSTTKSRAMYDDWKDHNCQPNFRRNVEPDPNMHCGPYKPIRNPKMMGDKTVEEINKPIFGEQNHDTIGLVAIDTNGKIAAGTSTNGAIHKIPGRVGDSPIPGSGAYADSDVGGAAATGDGDVMMRFLPSLIAVEKMRQGFTPMEASNIALKRIVKHYPAFSGAVIAVSMNGEYGAACHKLEEPFFPYTVGTRKKGVRLEKVDCFTT